MESNYRKVCSEINCGFARCAMRDLTPKDRSEALNIAKRLEEYRKLFQECLAYVFSTNYFNANPKNGSLFDRECTNIKNIWTKSWNPKEARTSYESTFSITNWKKKTVSVQQKHMLRNCVLCHQEHPDNQTKSPQGPYFNAERNIRPWTNYTNC